MLRCQFAKFGAEDDGLLVAIRVDQHDVAAALREGGLEDRDHRSDTAACTEEQEVVIERLGREDT